MRVKLNSFGPIAEADVSFGNLTVLVGPQATGNSILLRLLKLLLDRRAIHIEMQRFGLDWGGTSTSYGRRPECVQGDGESLGRLTGSDGPVSLP